MADNLSILNSEIDTLIRTAKQLGNLETVRTFCGHEYYNIHQQYKTIIYIPDDVEAINECDPVIEQDDIYPKFNEYTADLKVIGGKGLKNASSMFRRCKASTVDLSEFDAPNITDMSYMFSECFSHTVDFSRFNTKQVTDMFCMFEGCRIKHIDLRSFDTSKVVDMSNMFCECEADLIDLTSFVTSDLTDLHDMFDDCQAKVNATDKNILIELEK